MIDIDDVCVGRGHDPVLLQGQRAIPSFLCPNLGGMASPSMLEIKLGHLAKGAPSRTDPSCRRGGDRALLFGSAGFLVLAVAASVAIALQSNEDTPTQAPIGIPIVGFDE